MPVIQHLDQAFIDTQLICPPDKVRSEIVDPQRTGLYIEVRRAVPRQGTYYLRYKDAAGKTCHSRIGLTTEMTLEDARTTALNQKAAFRAASGKPVVVSTPSMTAISSEEGRGSMPLDKFMTDHYFPFARNRKRSFGRDEQLYRLRIKAKFGSFPLKAISRLAMQQFQDALLEEGLAKASVNQHLILMRRVLNLAVQWEMLDRNVLTRIELYALDNQREHYLDDEQVQKLVGVLKTDKNRLVCLALLFLLSTGARLREGLNAEWRHVDLAKETWTIPAANSKSKKQKHLPLNESAMWVLRQLDTADRSPYLFPSKITGKPFTGITLQWYRLRKKAGIPAHTRIHDLRHTFASRMVTAGCSLYEVKELLGHADMRTSQRYAHMADSVKRAASAKAAFAIA